MNHDVFKICENASKTSKLNQSYTLHFSTKAFRFYFSLSLFYKLYGLWITWADKLLLKINGFSPSNSILKRNQQLVLPNLIQTLFIKQKLRNVLWFFTFEHNKIIGKVEWRLNCNSHWNLNGSKKNFSFKWNYFDSYDTNKNQLKLCSKNDIFFLLIELRHKKRENF